MADEPKFLINGAEYPIPLFDTFTIDECRVFHDWTGIHVEEVEDTPVNSQMIAAFMQIAYMRGNPTVKAQTARDLVGGSNFAEALERFNQVEEAAEADAAPLDGTPTPSGELANNEDSPSTSGGGSTTFSAGPANGRNLGGSQALAASVTSGSPTSGS